MSLEGLWTIEYEVPRQPNGMGGWMNGGVVILETGRVFGGDSFFYFTGHFSVSPGSAITGKVTLTHYAGQNITAWGDPVSSYEATLQGTTDAKGITGLISRKGFAPQIPFRMMKRAELP